MSVALEWMVSLGMNEYINKEYIRNIELKRWNDACGAESYAYSCVLEDIAEAPIADVEVVRHAKWIPFANYDAFKCSKCGRVEFNKEPYCHCGAKMI